MDKLFAARNYLKYRLRAGNAHDVHSPFVFELFNNVIRDDSPFYGFEPIESLRAVHLLDEKEIEVLDFGTGVNHRKEKISSIARKSLKPKKYAQLLFRLVNRFQPENILEIGTSLGITTLYLSMPSKNSRVITLEGCPEISNLSEKNFNRLRRDNIEIITGEFSETLPIALKKLPRLDFVYFDGNHREDATLSYFEKCIPLINEDSAFVFDDIHWSPEMESAWEKIKSHSSVTISIDLFQIGIVFFKKGFSKEEFVLKF